MAVLTTKAVIKDVEGKKKCFLDNLGHYILKLFMLSQILLSAQMKRSVIISNTS